MKSLTELTTEIITSQMQHKSMTTEEITNTLQEVFQTLNQLKTTGTVEGDAHSNNTDKPVTDPKRSILNNKIICLECGQEFKQLSANHLVTHDLSPKDYRQKYSFPASQPLSCKSLTERRKKAGKERGLPAVLKKKQAAARRKKKNK